MNNPFLTLNDAPIEALVICSLVVVLVVVSLWFSGLKVGQ